MTVAVLSPIWRFASLIGVVALVNQAGLLHGASAQKIAQRTTLRDQVNKRRPRKGAYAHWGTGLTQRSLSAYACALSTGFSRYDRTVFLPVRTSTSAVMPGKMGIFSLKLAALVRTLTT